VEVGLAYGRGRLQVPLRGPDPLVVRPQDPPALDDPAAAVRRAIRAPLGCPPLAALVRDGDRVAISVCDGTRAQPRELVLRGLLDEIEAAAPRADVTVLVATGTHRGNTPAELEAMLGADVLRRVRVVNHDARDAASLVDLGVHGDGVRLLLDRVWVDADVRLTTGFVEPHFFAGFSGGPKMVVPGLAGLDTVMTLHDARRIGDPAATWGPVEANPVHRDIRACAAACPPQLALDVLLDGDKRITHVYAGELFAMHAAACATALEVAMRPVPRPFEVVVTTGSGFPLDQNLYQAVKGLAAAERVVADGGTIVLAAECEDGLPDHGSFTELLHAAGSPAALDAMIREPGFSRPDQWQVQVLARILGRARVLLHSSLPADVVRAAHLEPAPDPDAAVRDALATHGRRARACYLPEGPQTIPYLAA
jgi:nickel-dependent lactate racemase